MSGVFITQTAGELKVDTIVLDVAPLPGGTPGPLSPTVPAALAVLLDAAGVATLRGRSVEA